jgi:beta-glucosidase
VTDLMDLPARPAPAPDVAELAGRFPRDFTWGVATSAYQIEGAANEDGRGPSIWDTFSREPGRVENGETGDVASDHYHRLSEDLEILSRLGVSAYRFSVSWPRVLPAGVGAANEAGLAFYDRLVDGLMERQIRPMLTLYHWDLPQALQDRGGWTNLEIVDWFADYAGLLADRFGDRVTEWLTLNEPQVFAFHGNADGGHAPGLRDWPTALRVADSALRAHAAAASSIRAAVPSARIGAAINVNWVDPASEAEADRAAAARFSALNLDWFLDPLFGKGYPTLAVEAHAAAGHLDNLELASPPSGDLDFLGLNYYTHQVIASDPAAPFGLSGADAPGVERTTMGWEVYPDGLRQVLRRLHRDYAPPEIMVTENGAAFPEPRPDPAGKVADDQRRRFLERHISATADAIDEGIPVSGYYVWSLLDNFEWAKGYGQRFGIVHVDYTTLERTVKDSGEWYASLVKAARG